MSRAVGRKEFYQKINNALNDKTLHHNLDIFFHNFKNARKKAYENIDFDSLRFEINKIKEFNKDEWLKLFHEFKSNVEKSGSIVYQAKDAKDACEYIASVCKKHGTEYIVKSKSMTAEEIGLNTYLEKEGLRPIETDLGEWILQIAHETPSHMVIPAIHKNRYQIAKLFKEHIGIDVDENDIEKMVKIAREYLREYYFKAKVGITGANIAVAETGTIGIFTNEGNARLTTTIPPVHIVLLGYDKLVRDFVQALKITRVLPKNATGQIISVYVTWIKGRYPSISDSSGKKEIYYVFLDNGRLSLFDNETIKESFKCIRCGSCANVCPTYGIVGGHVFGDIYTGPIGLVNTVLYGENKKAKELLKLCIGCKACSSICPAGIDVQKLISDLNIGMSEKYGIDIMRKFFYSNIMSGSNVFKNLMQAGSFIQAPLKSKDKTHINSTTILSKEKDFRVFPTIARHTFTQLFKNQTIRQQNYSKKIFFYPGCAIEYFYPDIGIALVKLLNKANIAVNIPQKAVCCGLPAIHSGDKSSAKKTILNNIRYMGNPDEYESFIILCPTCGSTIKEHFKYYLSDNINEFKKSINIEKRVESLSMFLKNNNIRFRPKNGLKITYHTPCHQNRVMHFSAEEMLKDILQDNFIPLKDTDACCGFGGTFSFDFPGISKAILDKKIQNIVDTKADIILTDCPGCIIQIEGGLLKRKEPILALHLSDFFLNYLEIEQ